MASTGAEATDSAVPPPREALSAGGRLAGFGGDVLQIIGLCGMAVLQPLLSKLGPNPTYFVAHDLTGDRIIVFVAVIMLAPPLVFSVVVLAARLLAPRAARHVSSAVKGLLAAAAVVAVFGLASRLPTAPYVLVAVLLVAGLAFAFHRRVEIRTFATALSPMPLLFAGAFLFTSASGELVGASDPEAVAAATSDTSVYMLIFDEFPTAALITPDGDLDRERFPGFARLSDLSTWYPQAATVDHKTVYAVPAMLTGRLVTGSRAPVAEQYPHSLFTMLGDSHTMNVVEEVTQLCPRTLCERPEPKAADTAKDTAILVGFPLLPENTARDLYPGVGNQWADFASSTVPTDGLDLDLGDFIDETHTGWDFGASTIPIFDDFLGLVATETEPTVGLLHLLLPHAPFNFLPDGTRYPGSRVGMVGWEKWVDDEEVVAVARQRFLFQVGYVDRLVDTFLDTLEATGKLDDAMVIVVADHGTSFEPGGRRRATFHDEVLPVPLFIKYPGDDGGRVDDRRASTLDVLPTIADQLDATLPARWSFDGESLLEPTRRDLPPVLDFRHDEVDPAHIERLDPVRGHARYEEWHGSYSADHDLYRLGPHGSLVGRAVENDAAPVEGAGAPAADLASLASASPEDDEIPVLVDVGLTGVPDDAWLAVSINDTVAGVGPAYRADGGLRLTAMVDPSLLRSAGNDVELHLIEDDQLRPIELTD